MPRSNKNHYEILIQTSTRQVKGRSAQPTHRCGNSIERKSKLVSLISSDKHGRDFHMVFDKFFRDTVLFR